jgi:hypothetical protein
MTRAIYRPVDKDVRLSRGERREDPERIAIENLEISTRVSERDLRQPRASDLYETCIRKHVLAYQTGRREIEKISFPLALTFGSSGSGRPSTSSSKIRTPGWGAIVGVGGSASPAGRPGSSGRLLKRIASAARSPGPRSIRSTR